MGHGRGETVFPAGLQHFDRTVEVARLKAPRADDAELLPRDGVRVEGDVSGVSLLAKHQKLCSIAA